MENRYDEFPINSIRICIDFENEETREIAGRICSVALQTDLSFHNRGNLILLIDEAFDLIGRPQPFQLIRSFREDTLSCKPYVGQPARYHSSEEIHGCLGTVRTFDLIMISRKHAEWQGILKNTEGRTLGSFQSSLECIKLL